MISEVVGHSPQEVRCLAGWVPSKKNEFRRHFKSIHSKAKNDMEEWAKILSADDMEEAAVQHCLTRIIIGPNVPMLSSKNFFHYAENLFIYPLDCPVNDPQPFLYHFLTRAQSTKNTKRSVLTHYKVSLNLFHYAKNLLVRSPRPLFSLEYYPFPNPTLVTLRLLGPENLFLGGLGSHCWVIKWHM